MESVTDTTLADFFYTLSLFDSFLQVVMITDVTRTLFCDYGMQKWLWQLWWWSGKHFGLWVWIFLTSEVEITDLDSDSSVDIQAVQWVEVKIQVYHTAQNI
jgi:hypothetical protein